MKYNRFTRYKLLVPMALALCGQLSTIVTAVKAETTIGVLTTLSGNASLLGKQLELGARLAVDRLQSVPLAFPVRLSVIDSACDDKQAKIAAKQLLLQNVKFVIGPLCSKALYAALEILSPAGVPVIVPYIRASRLDWGRKKRGWLVYTLASGATSETENIARILLKRWQGKAYAIADDGGIYGRGIADEFRNLAETSGQKPVALANFRPLQSNQFAMLRRLAKNGIEALFVGGEASDIAQIARDAKKLGLEIEIAGGESLVLLPHVDEAATIPPGILAVLAVEPTLAPESTNFAIELQQKNIELEGALLPGYALIQIAAQAAANRKLKLEGQTFQTIMGDLSFNNEGRAGAYKYQLYVWRDQQISPMSGF